MRTDTVTRAPTKADAIVFLLEPPTKPHTVIATIVASDDGNGTDISKRLRQEAAKLGGQAVYVVKTSESTIGAAAGAGGAFAGAVVPKKDQTAHVIVFTEPPR